MDLMRDIADVSLIGFGAILLAMQCAFLLLGSWTGRRRARQLAASGADTTDGVGVVVGGLLGLLAFTLSVSIGIAESRYEERRRATLDEANAIGTAWLRAQATGHPRGHEIARLLESYTAARIAWVQARPNSPVLQGSLAEADRLQTLIWGHAAGFAAERQDAIVASLMASLNETFDLTAAQRWAFRSGMPMELPWLLLWLTLISVGAIGFQWGLRDRWYPVMAVLLLSAWSACLVLIADLSSPRMGEVRVDVAPYLWTQSAFRGGVTIPPLH